MELIVKVTSPGLRMPLADLLRLPLGLDVWEAKPDHLILRGTEAQLDRLSSMGYGVEELDEQGGPVPGAVEVDEHRVEPALVREVLQPAAVRGVGAAHDARGLPRRRGPPRR